MGAGRVLCDVKCGLIVGAGRVLCDVKCGLIVGAGRVLCDDVLCRCMRTCVLSVSSMVGRSVGRSVDPGTTSRHFHCEKYRI